LDALGSRLHAVQGSCDRIPMKIGVRTVANGPSVSSVSGYIIPLMSGVPPADSLSGISATMASVVRMFLAIDAAFCSAIVIAKDTTTIIDGAGNAEAIKGRINQIKTP
jgi:hypothetical protein